MFSLPRDHTLAVKKDGSLWAWGQNNISQLGDATKVPKNTPQRVAASLNVAISGLGSGTISASGLTCGQTSCTGLYEYGSAITLTASPNSGSAFSNWSDDNCPGTDPCTFTTTQLSSKIYAFFNDTSTPTGTVSISAGYLSGATKYTGNPTLNLTLSANDPAGIGHHAVQHGRHHLVC